MPEFVQAGLSLVAARWLRAFVCPRPIEHSPGNRPVPVPAPFTCRLPDNHDADSHARYCATKLKQAIIGEGSDIPECGPSSAFRLEVKERQVSRSDGSDARTADLTSQAEVRTDTNGPLN